MRLSDAVSDAVARGATSGSYMGTVTAIDTVGFSLTVDIGTGTPLTGVRWIASYAPAVSDFVVVLRVGSGWQVLGRLSKNLAASGQPVQGVTTVDPIGVYGGRRESGSTWSWFSATGPTYQGLDGARTEHQTVYVYDSLSSVLPAGATVQSVKVRATRWPDDSRTGLVTPRIHGHTETSAPSGGALWAAGYGPMPAGALSAGESAQWDLPSLWVGSLLAGTIRGLGLNSARSADYSIWDRSSGRLTITYTTPA